MILSVGLGFNSMYLDVPDTLVNLAKPFMTGVRAGTYPFVQRSGEYGGHIYHDLIAHESEPFLDRAICKCVLKAH